MVGREQVIEIGPMSGLSNVKCWLRNHGYDPMDEALCQTLFDAAKSSDRMLSTADLERLINSR